MDVPEESVSIGGEFDDKVFSPSRLKIYNTRRQHWEVTRENSTTRLSAAASTQKDTSLSKVHQSFNSDVAIIDTMDCYVASEGRL